MSENLTAETELEERGPLDVGEELARRVERAPRPPETPEGETALQMAHRMVELLDEKQATDILLLDIRGVTLIADYFIICTAGSDRQTGAILRDLADNVLEEFGRKSNNPEGRGDSGWLLLDYGDVIVHVFSAVQRDFYKLEELWAEATPVVRIQ